jgi:(p)ppGpp synthase/HD superfamily hydrolase
VAVTGIVSCYTQNPDVIAAAWLHDIVEDCEDIDLDVVEAMTNRRVREIVDLLTDPPGPRALAKQVSLPRVARDPDAALIKLADRYHNQASTIIQRSQRFARMYLAEYDAFIEAFVRENTTVNPLFDNLRMQWRDLTLIDLGTLNLVESNHSG